MKNETHPRWLMCRPTHFDVSYEINPWMSVGRKPSSSNANDQWGVLYDLLLACAPCVELAEPQAGKPDMVFTANAALVKGNRAMIATFRYSERQGESAQFRKWFEENDYVVSTLRQGYFEGEGDALFAGNKLFAGWGFRSGPEVFEKVAAFLDVDDLTICEMIDPRFYHLDTCFAPISTTEAVFYPKAFTEDSIKKLESQLNLIEVEEDEALKFACNQVVVGKHIIVPDGCPKLCALLEEKGYETHSIDLSEFLKAGGAAKCMVLKI